MTTFSDVACAGHEETIYLYLDNELSPRERTAFETHLAACPACQALLAEAQTLFAELATVEPVTMPDAAVSAAAAQVMTRLPAPRKMRHVSPVMLLLLALQLAVGLILLGLTAPRFITPYPAMLQTLVSIETAGWLEDAYLWLAASAFQLPLWLAAQGQLLADFLPLDLSPQMAFIVLPALGLAWLLSNGLLLRRRATSMQNGGTS